MIPPETADARTAPFVTGGNGASVAHPQSLSVWVEDLGFEPWSFTPKAAPLRTRWPRPPLLNEEAEVTCPLGCG